MRSSLAAAFAILLVSTAAQAADRCMVTDPTSTPLNVRQTPNGPIVGSVANGKIVSITGYSQDANGKSWAKIGSVKGDPVAKTGWVFREFVSCF